MVGHDDDIIIAHSTPQGKGALALVRLSGKNVRSLLEKCAQLSSGKRFADLPSHTIHHGWVIDDTNAHVDEVMFIIMDGPKTFTGEDVIEITCHNNPFLIEAIIAHCIKKGARIAQEGEFTKRAFLRGKLDLLQAEAINELIGANTQHALKQSLAQLEGSFSYWIQALEKDLVKTLAWCEASFEFLDEQVEFADRIRTSLMHTVNKIETLYKTFDAQTQIRQGIRIAFIGSVNAGKSSLFNALLNQKRAIVTPIAGTTRDAIEATLSHKGNYWTLVDTAGLRQTDDIIEQEGILRSHAEAHKADIIILVIDRSKALTQQEKQAYLELYSTYQNKCIITCNKTDLPAHPQSTLLPAASVDVSSVTQENLSMLHHALEEKIAALFAALDSPFLLNKRHHSLLMSLEAKIKTVLGMLTGSVQYELVSYHLQDALTLLSELTGKSISEAGLDTVFKEFCVGK